MILNEPRNIVKRKIEIGLSADFDHFVYVTCLDV